MPRARLQRGKQARPSGQQKKPRVRLQRGKQARTSTQREKPRDGSKKQAAAATALEEAAPKQRQSRQEQRELYAHLTRKTHETHCAAWCAAEARKLNDSYFPGVSAHVSFCALASFALAPLFALRCSSFVSVDPAAPHARRRAFSPKSKKEPTRPHSAAALGGGDDQEHRPRAACGTTYRRSGASTGSAPPNRSREPSPSKSTSGFSGTTGKL
jgi:hypothetical protein